MASPAARFAIGLGLVVLLVAALALTRSGPVPGVGSRPGQGNTVSWSTPYVSLTADDFRIVASSRVFNGPGASVFVHSDPGDARYRTLELGWPESGVEMRLMLYFAADDREWWVSEIRTYDGLPNTTGSNWVYFDGPFFRTPLGTTYEGDVDLKSNRSDNDVFGQLVVTGLRLRAFAAGASDAPARSIDVIACPSSAPSDAICSSVARSGTAGMTLYVRNGSSQIRRFATVPEGESVADHAEGSTGFNPNDMGVACISDPKARLVALDRNPTDPDAAMLAVIDDGSSSGRRTLWVDIGPDGTFTQGEGVPDWWLPPPQAC